MVSVSDSTAASTQVLYQKPTQDIPEELEENIWAESREGKREEKEEFIGEKAFMSYYKRYRQVSQDPDRQQNSPSVAFIRETNKMKIPPAPFGLIKRKGSVQEINVKHYNIGDRYGKALGGSIKHIKPKVINLGSNKNTKGISSIIRNLGDDLEKLDLSDNYTSLKSIIDL